MNLPDDFTFTQGSLQDAADCQRRFALRCIKRLRYPAVEARPALLHERRSRQGARFHKMAQQHLLGVPADLLADTLHDDEELAEWWRVFRANGLADLPARRQAEVTLQAHLDGHRLIAKVDLLAWDPGGEAVIVDWKTWRRTPSEQALRSRMQTVLYRYVLARAGTHLYGGPIPADKIRMVYCFVARQGERVAIDYSPAQMQADEARLRDLINTVDSAQDFPLTDDETHCRFCTYRSLCERGEAGDIALFDEEDETDDETFTLDFDAIAEIAF